MQNKCSSYLRSFFLLFLKIADIRKSFFRQIQSRMTWSYRCKKFIFSMFIISYDISYVYGFDLRIYTSIFLIKWRRGIQRMRHALNSLISRSLLPEYNNSGLLYGITQQNVNSGTEWTNWNFSRWRFYGFVDPAAPFIHSHPSQSLSIFVSLFHVAIPMHKWELSRPLRI